MRFSLWRTSSTVPISAGSATRASSAEPGRSARSTPTVRQHRVGAAGLAIDAHAGLEIVPAAVAARRRPALVFLGGQRDPAMAAPGADQDRWAAFAARPGRQRAAGVGRLATPRPAHDVERGPQRAEPRGVVVAQQVEVVLGRTAADAKNQAVARQRLHGLHAVGKLDRMTQRQLQHADAQFDLRVTAASAASSTSGSSVGRPRPSESPTQMPGNPLASIRRA